MYIQGLKDISVAMGTVFNILHCTKPIDSCWIHSLTAVKGVLHLVINIVLFNEQSLFMGKTHSYYLGERDISICLENSSFLSKGKPVNETLPEDQHWT